MSTRRWPYTLPGPSVDGYGRTNVEMAVRTQMEVGAQRVRRRSLALLDRIRMTWRMTPQEYAVYRKWYEGRAVSLIGSSDDLSAWTMVAATRAIGAALSPDFVICDGVREQATSAQHRAQVALPGAAIDNLTVQCAATIQAVGRSKMRIQFVDRALVTDFADIDLTTGVVANITGLTDIRIVDRGNGWWRVTWSASTGVGASVPSMRILLRDDSGTSTYLGDIAKGINLCEVQAQRVTGYDAFVPSDAAGMALGAASGAAWFYTYLPTDEGLVWAEARFAGGYSEEITAGLNRIISSEFEVRYA